MNSKDCAAIAALAVLGFAAPICALAEEADISPALEEPDLQSAAPAQTYCFIHVQEFWAGQTTPFAEKTYQVDAGTDWNAAFEISGYTPVLTDASLNTAFGADAEFVTLPEVSKDQMVYVVYVPDQVSYTVELHYLDLDGNVEKIESYVKSGTVDALTEVEAPLVPGYLVSFVDQEYVRADGSTVVRICYQAAKYKINYHSAGTYIDPQEVSYENLKTWSSSAVSSRPGYIFSGWSYEENGAAITDWSEADLLAHSENNVINLYALWEADTINYVVRYWIQNSTNDVNASNEEKTYGYLGSAIRQAKTGETVMPAEDDINKGTLTDQTDSWFGLIFNDSLSSKQIEVSADGTATLDVYYDRAKVRYVFYDFADNSFNTVDQNKGEVLGEYEGLHGSHFGNFDKTYQWRTYDNGEDNTEYKLWSELGTFDARRGEAAKLDGDTFTINLYRHSKVTSYKAVGFFYERYDGSFAYDHNTVQASNVTSVHFVSLKTGLHYAYYKQLQTDTTLEAALAAFDDPDYLTGEYWHTGGGIPQPLKDFVLYFNRGRNVMVLVMELDTFTLELNRNGSNLKDSFQVKYTTPLDETWAKDVWEAMNNPQRPDDLLDYLEFAGWYMDKDFTTPFTSASMPASNLALYAKWAPKMLTVTVHDEVNDVYTLDVVGGEQVSSLNIPSNGNAIFVGWYLDKDYSVLFDGQKTITEDVDIYAKWQRISTTTTTIRYIDEYGNELLDSVIVEGIPGQYMAAVAQTIKGYSPVNLAAKVLMQDGSVINFVYKSLDSLWYQVQYVLKDGTVIAQDPIQRISNLDEIKIYANVPNGWKLADEKDQDKVILSAGISSNPDQPTLISILLEMPKVSGTLDDPEEESPEEKAKKTDAPAEPKQDAKSETKSQVKTAVPAASMWAWMAGISAGMFGILKKRKFK